MRDGKEFIPAILSYFRSVRIHFFKRLCIQIALKPQIPINFMRVDVEVKTPQSLETWPSKAAFPIEESERFPNQISRILWCAMVLTGSAPLFLKIGINQDSSRQLPNAGFLLDSSKRLHRDWKSM